MTYQPDLHRRRSLRLQGYDYAQAGAYFLTLCTQDRECLFGEIVDREMRLNDEGRVVADEWFKTAQIREHVFLNAVEFVVMPNHVHGILWIVDVGATRRVAPTPYRAVPTGSGPRPTGPVSGSVGAIMV
jgi:hypothetical protein